MARFLFLLTLALLPHALIEAQEEIRFSPPPGAYASPQEVTLSGSGALQFRLGRGERFLPVQGAIVLDALPGTVERYRLEVRSAETGGESQTVDYTIDRKPPTPPTSELPEGRYLSPVTIRFREAEELTLEYRRNGSYVPFPASGLLLDPGSGRREAYTLRVRAIDAVGNSSAPRELLYVVDRTYDTLLDPEEKHQILLSPRPGEYRNAQLLLPESRLWKEVRYTVDGTDPREGKDLAEPTFLEETGTIELRVGAVSRIDGGYREERLTLIQENGSSPFPASGIWTEKVTVEPPEQGRLSFSLDPRADPTRGQLLLAPLVLEAPPGNRRFVFFSAAPLGSPGPPYAHAYLLDNRRPPEPTVLLERVDARTLRLTAFSLPEARIRYEVTGVEAPGAYDYSAPTLLSVPEGSAAVVGLSVRAELPGGAQSDSVIREIRLSTTAPTAPKLSVRERSPSESVEIFVDAPHPIFLGALGQGEDRIPPTATTDEPFLSFTPPPGMEGSLRFSGRSVSEDGWLWSSPTTVEARIDTLPPEPPRLEVEAGRFRLSGPGKLEYRVSADLEAAPSNTGGYVPYEGSVPLRAPESSLVRYTVEARSVDEAGNVSETVTERYSADAREAAIPPIRGIQDGGRYREAELFLIFQNPYPEDLQLFYELREGERSVPTPPTPNRESPSVRERFRIETPEGVERTYRMRVRAGFPTGALSDTEEITFTVDRIPPEPPRVLLPGDGSPYARDVEVRLSGGEGERYIAISEEEPADPLGPRGQRYAAPVRVAGREGEAIRYFVTAASRDTAGNAARVEEPVSFILDREPPAPPEILLSGTPEEGNAVRSTPGTVTLQGEGTLYLSYARRGRSASLTEFSGEGVTLSGEEGAVVSYQIEAFSIDRAGNRSVTRRLELTMDRERPPVVAQPEIVYAPDGRSGTLIWPPLREGALILSRRENLEFLEREAESEDPLSGTLRWRLREGESEGTVVVYVQDSAGNRSEAQRVRIPERTEPPAPAFSGVPEGGVTNEPVRLAALEQGPEPVTIRYTVSSDGTLPPTVTEESPRFGEAVSFSAGRGETISYVMSARAYNAAGEASEAQLLRFTVDREPPRPPTISGVRSGEYYPEAQSFTLSGEGEIYYRVLRQGGARSSGEFNVYRGEGIELPARENELISYQIEAYTRDEAGNRSQHVEQWHVFVDREIIYVSSSQGAPGNDGSRNAPFATVDEALRLLRNSERSTLFLDAGSYTIHEELSFRRPVRIIGGFGGENWRPEAGRTTLLLPAAVAGETEAGSSFMLEAGGSLTLRRITVESSREEPVAGVAEGASLLLEESALESVASTAVHLLGGDLRLTESTVSVPRGGRSIRTEDGSYLLIRGGDVAPMELTRSDYEIHDSVLRATPITTEAATALIARESRGTITGSVIRADAREEHLLLLELVAGRLRILESELIGEAGTGVTLLRSRNSDITIDRGRLRASGAESYVYGLVGRGGRVAVTNSVITAGGGGSAIGLSQQGGELSLAQNTVLFGDLRESYFLSVGNLSELSLFNSQLHQRRPTGNGEHTLLYLDGPVNDLRIAGNNISGWTRIVTDGAATGASWGFTSPGVLRRVDELHRSTVALPSVTRFRAFENIHESAELTFAAGPDVLREGQYGLQLGSASVGGGIPLDQIDNQRLRSLLERDYAGDPREPGAERSGRPSIGAVRF
ncbi:MAG: hypothetical protein ACLFQZ_02005 [Spirochaetaceae bacterium]